MGTRIFNYLNHYVCTTVSKDVNLNRFNSSGELYCSQACAITKRQAANIFKVRSLFTRYSPQAGTLEERSRFNCFYTCRECNFSQIIAVAECTVTQGLQLGILLKFNSLQSGMLEECINTNMCNLVSYYNFLDGISILYRPRCINTIGGVILYCALAAKIHSSISQQDVLNVCSRITGIHNGRIGTGNERTLFIKGASITENVDIATNSNTMSIVEINLGENGHFSCGKHTCVKVTVCVDRSIVEEAVKFRLICANAVIAEIVVVTVDLMKTGQLHAVLVVGFSNPTVCHNDAINIGLSVGIYTVKQIAATAQEFAANSFVGMSRCGNGSTPFYNGITAFTEGSSGVTVLGTGCRLVSNSRRGMNVTTVPCSIIRLAFRSLIHCCKVAPHFGVAEYAITRKGIYRIIYSGQNTLVNIRYYGHSPEFLHALEISKS